MGVKPYNSNDFSIRRSDELFSFSALRVLTGVATQGMLLNKRVRLHHVRARNARVTLQRAPTSKLAISHDRFQREFE